MLETASLPKHDKALSPPNALKSSEPSQMLSRAGGLATTLLIGLGLLGFGIWGYSMGWTVPKFSVLTGNGAGDKDDWCAEHSVPESVCVECNSDLLPKGKEFGWCKKHGVQECPLCHPEVAQVRPSPYVTQAEMDRAQRGLEFAERTENNSKCKLQHRRLQFASQAAAAIAGVEVGPVTQAPMSEFIAASGEISYDQTRVARLASRLPAIVGPVNKQVGDRVQKDEVLALVEAAEVGRAKAEFLQALAQLDLKTKIHEGALASSSAVSGRSIQEAEAGVTEARIRLVSAQQALINLGLPIQAEEVKSLVEEKLAERVRSLGLPDAVARSTTTANLLPIISPTTGIVVSREAVPGEVVDTSKVLFTVADTRQMWLNLDVRVEDAQRISLGQPVTFQADGDTQTVTGQVVWISTAVDEKTRTVKVRAGLDNSDGKLRASTFGAGRIILREEKEAIVVAKDAVHWEGCCHIVFVRDKDYLDETAPKVFHVRKVVPGARTEKNVEVIAGLLPGEVVATAGSGILRSELLKNNLGAG